MYSQALRWAPDLRLVAIGRRLTRLAKVTTAPFCRARYRRPRPWVNLEANLLNADRAQEESYRDYIFRKSIWP